MTDGGNSTTSGSSSTQPRNCDHQGEGAAMQRSARHKNQRRATHNLHFNCGKKNRQLQEQREKRLAQNVSDQQETVAQLEKMLQHAKATQKLEDKLAQSVDEQQGWGQKDTDPAQQDAPVEQTMQKKEQDVTKKSSTQQQLGDLHKQLDEAHAALTRSQEQYHREQQVQSATTSAHVLRPDWTWLHEIKSMRIVADVSALEDMLHHAKQHVWYLSILKEMNDPPNDPTKVQLLIVNLIHRVVSFGLQFDANCFLHVLCALRMKAAHQGEENALTIEEYKTKIIQDTFHQLRTHTGVDMMTYSRWCTQLELPEPEEKRIEDLHVQNRLEAKKQEHEAMEKKLEEHEHEKDVKDRIGNTLSAF